MTTEEIKTYYNDTKLSETRPDLLKAIELVNEPKIAVDCGCGSGSDINYLVSQGFTVHGYDIEDESISMCKERFKNNNKVILSKDSFSTFNYPRTSLILADASLFYCPESEFGFVWQKIHESLYTEGVFCGSFLGTDDTMAKPGFSKQNLWKNIMIFNEKQVKNIFKNYEICIFTEHKLSGKTSQGTPHDWHIFSVIARKEGIPFKN
ncbi:MAG: methyltransferase domain-containing protein [Gammaproteobacteria bacterium]|nr:methyltransferase domain-containing protein [Gammaproteobacteria bacterium]